MSQQNVELVRQGYAAFAENGVEGAIRFFTEDAVIYSIPEWLDHAEYRGHDGLRKLNRQWRENFDDFGMDVRELHDGGDTVVALVELTGQTKASAIPMTMQIGVVISEFRDGRVGRQDLFSTWDAAWKRPGCEGRPAGFRIARGAVVLRARESGRQLTFGFAEFWRHSSSRSVDATANPQFADR